MATIYWIEDEPELLDDLKSELEGRGHTVVELHDVDTALGASARMHTEQGPIVLDLFLPSAEFDGELVTGPDVALRFLDSLDDSLLTATPIFVVSGNVDLELLEQLQRKYGIPRERIFDKPLNEDFQRLVYGIHASCSDS